MSVSGNDDMWKQYNIFTSLFAGRGTSTTCATAFVRFYSEDGMDVRKPLVAMTIDDVKNELDVESRLVQCLLEQMTTYNCSKEKILALVFDKRTVLSDVIRVE